MCHHLIGEFRMMLLTYPYFTKILIKKAMYFVAFVSKWEKVQKLGKLLARYCNLNINIYLTIKKYLLLNSNGKHQRKISERQSYHQISLVLRAKAMATLRLLKVIAEIRCAVFRSRWGEPKAAAPTEDQNTKLCYQRRNHNLLTGADCAQWISSGLHSVILYTRRHTLSPGVVKSLILLLKSMQNAVYYKCLLIKQLTEHICSFASRKHYVDENLHALCV